MLKGSFASRTSQEPLRPPEVYLERTRHIDGAPGGQVGVKPSGTACVLTQKCFNFSCSTLQLNFAAERGPVSCLVSFDVHKQCCISSRCNELPPPDWPWCIYMSGSQERQEELISLGRCSTLTSGVCAHANTRYLLPLCYVRSLCGLPG